LSLEQDDGHYDAILLAVVGLRRLGFGGRIAEVLDEQMLGYAVGQVC
jgi:hydroxymethylbilane synthase